MAFRLQSSLVHCDSLYEGSTKWESDLKLMAAACCGKCSRWFRDLIKITSLPRKFRTIMLGYPLSVSPLVNLTSVLRCSFPRYNHGFSAAQSISLPAQLLVGEGGHLKVKPNSCRLPLCTLHMCWLLLWMGKFASNFFVVNGLLVSWGTAGFPPTSILASIVHVGYKEYMKSTAWNVYQINTRRSVLLNHCSYETDELPTCDGFVA